MYRRHFSFPTLYFTNQWLTKYGWCCWKCHVWLRETLDCKLALGRLHQHVCMFLINLYPANQPVISITFFSIACVEMLASLLEESILEQILRLCQFLLDTSWFFGMGIVIVKYQYRVLVSPTSHRFYRYFFIYVYVIYSYMLYSWLQKQSSIQNGIVNFWRYRYTLCIWDRLKMLNIRS